ncbi:MAG: RNA pyrophosphohydrolase [Hyphomicrobiaceae bacterium]|nr:RNA pyrophosphohydrolase [Hyphomicrobiaceae bacterium]
MTHAKDLPYRQCVGVMLLNKKNQVWIGRRIAKWKGDGSQKLWQMPQGGIDKGETPLIAAMRELEEEIGTNNGELIGEHPQWLNYDLPSDVQGAALGGRFRGQTQKWFAMRYQGEDRDINIDGLNGHDIEFDQWRWAEIDELVPLVVSFKRHVYEQVSAHFKSLI